VEFDPQQIFILIPEEMERAVSSRKFQTIETIKILNYPNGEPWVLFSPSDYVDHVDELSRRRKWRETRCLRPRCRHAPKAQSKCLIRARIWVAIEYIFDGDNSSFIRAQLPIR
jgi:hypothetical protein